MTAASSFSNGTRYDSIAILEWLSKACSNSARSTGFSRVVPSKLQTRSSVRRLPREGSAVIRALRRLMTYHDIYLRNDDAANQQFARPGEFYRATVGKSIREKW
jgi:hypothetical protein